MRGFPRRTTGRSAAAHQPALVLRFAIVTALSLAAAGALVLFVIRNLDVRDAERGAIDRAVLLSDVVLKPELVPDDLRRPVVGVRRARLDAVVARHLRVQGLERIAIVGRGGRIQYSSDHRIIGRVTPDVTVHRAALRGAALGVVSERPTTQDGEDRVLTAFVPVVIGEKARALGTVALDLEYDTVVASADEAFLPVAGVFEIALVGLFVLLVPMLSSASRKLRRYAAELEHRAHHDELTALPNRYRFAADIDAALSERGQDLVAVMLVDLDRFKEINDGLGHAAGDVLLQEAADRLRTDVTGVTLARLGGDEFAVVACVADRTSAVGLARAVQGIIARPFELQGFSVHLDASVGVALAPDHGTSADILLRHADHAMYDAKRNGGGVFVYDPEADGSGADRLALMSDLRAAIDEGTLEVWYQPIVSLDGAVGHAAEALVRWDHPTRGLLGAPSFVPLAEQTGMIKSLNRFVLERALGQRAAWLEQGYDIDVSVNLTMADLIDASLPGVVADALERAGLAADGLIVEITESAAMNDSARVRENLERLRSMGIRLSIDDFGTGHSSLAYLQHLPVNTIKIDRSFAQAMLDDRGARAIVSATIQLARSLDLDVVGEGVESAETWDALVELGCTNGQGFYMSPPVAPEAFLELDRPAVLSLVS